MHIEVRHGPQDHVGGETALDCYPGVHDRLQQVRRIGSVNCVSEPRDPGYPKGGGDVGGRELPRVGRHSEPGFRRPLGPDVRLRPVCFLGIWLRNKVDPSNPS